MSICTEGSRICVPLPAAQLGENLLHLPEDVTKHRRLLEPHPVRTKAEPKPQGIVRGVLLVSSEAIAAETIFILVIFIVCHGIEEGVPKT